MELPPRITSELRQIDLLAQLEPRDFERVMARARYQTLEKDQRLFTQGQKATRFFIVRSGQIKLFRLSPDGQEKIIALRAPPQSFAEAVMFMERQVYPVNAGAVRPSAVVAIDTNTYRDVLRDSVAPASGSWAP
jgi:CRP-like cAMP-binding protein